MWQAPSSSFVKINFDSSVMGDSLASGFVNRDAPGRPISAAARHVRRAFVLVAEAVALRDSLVKAKEKGFTRVEVEEIPSW